MIGKTFFFEGKIDGKIIFKKKGQNGFGMTQYLFQMGTQKLLRN